MQISTPYRSRKLPPGGKPRGGTLSGDIRSHKVRSETLGQKRKILIYLPPDYETEPNKNYPVVYAQDGQSLFDERTAIHHSEWGMDEAAEANIKEGKMDSVIIVAVSNGGSGEARKTDYTPASDQRYGGGQADTYLEFLTDELKPMVDATYRTKPGPESTAVLGSSLGGLFSLHAGLSAPETFGLVGAISPSLWYAGQHMLERLESLPSEAQKPEKIWMDMGTKESNPDWSLDPISEFQTAEQSLRSQGYEADQSLLGGVYEGAEHTNEAWRQRVGEVLSAMFPPTATPPGTSPVQK